MGAVGCYTLDLYCDAEGHVKRAEKALSPELGEYLIQFPYEQENGEHGSACRSAARKRGWLISKHRAICPLCR